VGESEEKNRGYAQALVCLSNKYTLGSACERMAMPARPLWETSEEKKQRERGFDICTILPSHILCGVWHKSGSRLGGGGRMLRNGHAIVLQYGRLCR